MHRGNLRITDFGFMTTVENAALYQSCEIITLWYRPPELLLGTTKYGQEVDMWSAGYVIAALLLPPLPPPLGIASPLLRVIVRPALLSLLSGGRTGASFSSC
jgi:serine/threonine protein kinase